MSVVGVLLAAGAGRRFGTPKALASTGGELMVRRGLRVLAEGGCDRVCVVVGAAADEVRTHLPAWVEVVYAPDWAHGMGMSLRAGLDAVASLRPEPDAAMVHLVDLPDVPPEAVARVRRHAGPRGLARASFHGGPGHPVLFGSYYWAEISASLTGDRGARDWLRGRSDLTMVECSDLATGADVDTPADVDP